MFAGYSGTDLEWSHGHRPAKQESPQNKLPKSQERCKTSEKAKTPLKITSFAFSFSLRVFVWEIPSNERRKLHGPNGAEKVPPSAERGNSCYWGTYSCRQLEGTGEDASVCEILWRY